MHRCRRLMTAPVLYFKIFFFIFFGVKLFFRLVFKNIIAEFCACVFFIGFKVCQFTNTFAVFFQISFAKSAFFYFCSLNIQNKPLLLRNFNTIYIKSQNIFFNCKKTVVIFVKKLYNKYCMTKYLLEGSLCWLYIFCSEYSAYIF